MDCTKGPWEEDYWIGTDEYDNPDRPFVRIGNVRWSPDKVDVPAALEQKANARLMATAPKMRDALIEGIITYIDWFDDAEECPYIQRQIAVVEEATGKTWDEIREEE